MDLIKLEQEKAQLEKQREQAIATVNQLMGAITIIDKLIKDLSKKEEIEEKIENK